MTQVFTVSWAGSWSQNWQEDFLVEVMLLAPNARRGGSRWGELGPSRSFLEPVDDVLEGDVALEPVLDPATERDDMSAGGALAVMDSTDSLVAQVTPGCGGAVEAEAVCAGEQESGPSRLQTNRARSAPTPVFPSSGKALLGHQQN